MNGELLLKIARQSIASAFGLAPEVDKEALVARYPELAREQATFVTLTINGGLRGCIGSIVPHRRLIDDLVANARAAAFEDPRFSPLKAEEFENVDIEVSLLSVPQPLEYTDIEDLRQKIRPEVDGVILQLDGRQATFLPQVWEDLNDFDLFFAHLCLKAGLPQNCLAYHPTIFTYQVEKFKECDSAGCR
ncbi:AmmeMemoRadiSam system protein A [Hydrogenimonas urashimensis]|uniref:AmmeMemoRadiSam system protein A n=1 Tax=Hydrogenimonas urashimensis TaxID=2740515 RepID=UPI001915432A|nr:AmmeMemoRadiSam system protein A [Hydrogenimonas urashimensis]